MVLTINDFKKALLDIAAIIENEKEYLSELDRAVGDGDHGVTMSIGWQAVKKKLEEDQSLRDYAETCKAVAMTFLNAVGSSVGPLYATAFLRGGKDLQGKTELNQEEIVQFWITAINGIQERGKAQVGDKTMMDTWIPAIEALQKSNQEGKDLVSCLEAAVLAAEKGMKSTTEMISNKGRSSRLGNRSVGHQDPGATSAYLILRSFLNSVKTKVTA